MLCCLTSAAVSAILSPFGLSVVSASRAHSLVSFHLALDFLFHYLDENSSPCVHAKKLQETSANHSYRVSRMEFFCIVWKEWQAAVSSVHWSLPCRLRNLLHANQRKKSFQAFLGIAYQPCMLTVPGMHVEKASKRMRHIILQSNGWLHRGAALETEFFVSNVGERDARELIREHRRMGVTAGCRVP
ncbi:uncharacterized protein LY89DRAFT_687908 [Mollisia scopiformis]|uniref:Secreted protein n=1 Tax=Mollisia scopiformis TaxID=149040 RepID=A0A194WYI1_MOLSC|nr:uncharacterized protein LY89DRAFT_687908 [Mollisia scopiformis]KUJ13018.1 hypothetical protein LY89DRAFT_687908 [Mollisia scopiformis]